MQTPAQIEFQGTRPSEAVRQEIVKHIARLEKRFGRMTACRVVVKEPGAHHRSGGLYEVNIRIALPDGREVDVGRTATADERHADVQFAVNDAFRRTRRRLQDHVRRMQGQTKAHEDRPIGKVTRLDEEGGFGFLESGDGREIYFHRNSVLDGAFGRLVTATRVYFSEEMGDRGPQASTVQIVGKHGLR